MYSKSRRQSYEESSFNGHDSYRTGSANDNTLPTFSHQMLHDGGATLIRRKLLERRRIISDGGLSATLMRDGYQDIELGNIAGSSDLNRKTENGNPASAAAVSNHILEELTYKDLYSLKEHSFPMAKKRELRANIIANHGNDGGGSEWTSRTNVKWRRFKEDAGDSLNQLQLWGPSLHEIEGRFGSGIGSYFAFLRWLFIVNVLTFLFILTFVVVPTAVFESLSNTTLVSSSTPIDNVSAECAYDPYDPKSINTFPQYIIWWFTGEGFMENTLLFYGYYDNAVTAVRDVYFYYDMSLAYLLVAFFYFFLNLVLVVRRASIGLRSSISTDDRIHGYFSKVFCAWDYCVTDQRTAGLKKSSLKYEFQSSIEGELAREKQKNRTRREKVVLYSKRALINFITLLFLGGALVAIFFAAQYALENGSTFENFFVDLLVTYLTSIVITALNLIAPLLFEFLVKFEDYTPEFTIRFTLIRTVILRLASIVFLYVVAYVQTNCDKGNPEVFDSFCNVCIGFKCWETHLGQEMYRLTVLNFFVVLAVTFLVEFPRKLIVTHCDCCGLSKWLGQQEFSIPTNVLDLVYIQTIAWIGSFYAPLLPVMVIIEFFVFFYLKKLTLLYNCLPASKSYNSSKTGTFFYLILLFGYLVAVVPVVFGIGILEPSQDCGPFRQLPTMFFVTTDYLADLPTWMQDIFWFLGSSGFSILVIILLSLVLHYYFTLATTNTKLIALLKNQLTLEGKDKKFLLSRVNQWTAKMKPSGGRVKKVDKVTKRRPAGEVNSAFVEDVQPPHSPSDDRPHSRHRDDTLY